MYNTIFKTAVTSNTSTAKEQLGAIRFEYDTTYGWRVYKYVQAASDTTVANGTALGYPTTDNTRTTVSSDATDFLVGRPAGVGIGAITASYYGWIN